MIITTFVAALAGPIGAQGNTAAATPQTEDSIRVLVSRLSLDRYRETVRGLTRFGDRRQGTARNRAATDWIEAQLKSYGCTNTERVTYQYTGRQLQNDSTRLVDSIARAARGQAPLPQRGGGGGGRAGGGGGGGGGGAGRGGAPVVSGPGSGRVNAQGIPVKGYPGPTGVNQNPLLQPDTALRRINAEWDTPGERQQVFCTKIGTTRPDEMYIIGAHMDGHGFGAAANDDGSGTALVMELARIFSSPDVQTERSIRFALWNNEETGLNGARAYVEQRKDLQGIENPAGSGRYPEPRWLGMIQHDMMMWDHGAPGSDGKVGPDQRREADVNIEFRDTSKFATEASKLAFFFRKMNDRYATDYPAAVGDRMSNTDSDPFKDLVPAISLRENERLAHTGSGWNPTWHQPIDVMSTFSDNDFRLGLNAAQTTLSAIASLTGAKIRK
ncbi:MAG: M28 family peptidase [Gemmatimonadaceae bacterium]